MEITRLVERVDELITHGEAVAETRYREGGSSIDYVDWSEAKGFRSAGLSFIHRMFGSDHPHFEEFSETTNAYFLSAISGGISILQAIRSEIAGGWLFTIKGLVAAELFADFLEMADHLLENGFKDAAAVMIGSVLEEHLRQLALKHKLPISDSVDDKVVPRKADRLNADLAQANVYSKLDQKAITAWLDLRNKAAHGKYSEYTLNQVKNFSANVTEFMARLQI